jgi:hypothetical protein
VRLLVFQVAAIPRFARGRLDGDSSARRDDRVGNGAGRDPVVKSKPKYFPIKITIEMSPIHHALFFNLAPKSICNI